LNRLNMEGVLTSGSLSHCLSLVERERDVAERHIIRISIAGFCSMEATDSETYQGATGNNSIPWGRPASLAAHERRRGEANFL
jgi:hypothetical protein